MNTELLLRAERIENLRAALLESESRNEELKKIIAAVIERSGPITITFDQMVAVGDKIRHMYLIEDQVMKVYHVEVI